MDVDEGKFEDNPVTLNDLSFGKPIAKGSYGVVYAAKIDTQTSQNESEPTQIDETIKDDEVQSQVTEVGNVIPKKIKVENEDDITKFPLALKMMFNYDVQSSAMAILRAMYAETVPARVYFSNLGTSDWELE